MNKNLIQGKILKNKEKHVLLTSEKKKFISKMSFKSF